MKIGIAADHGGYALKNVLKAKLQKDGHEVTDYGAKEFDGADDYPDFVVPLARSIGDGTHARGIAVCGSGVGASIAANKVKGVRAALVHDSFSAHQGVEDDDMNLLCVGGRIVGEKLAEEIVEKFLSAAFTKEERHVRRLNKVKRLEN